MPSTTSTIQKYGRSVRDDIDEYHQLSEIKNKVIRARGWYYLEEHSRKTKNGILDVVDETMQIVQKTGLNIDVVLKILLDDIRGISYSNQRARHVYGGWIQLLELIEKQNKPKIQLSEKNRKLDSCYEEDSRQCLN